MKRSEWIMLWTTLLVKIRGCSHYSSPPSLFFFTYCQFLWTIPNKWVAAELQRNQIHISAFSSLSFPECQMVFLSLRLLFTFTLQSGLFFLSPVLFPFPSLPPSSASLSVSFAPLYLSLSGWVPAVELVGLVAGVTARLSGVASDQGGRRAARTIGAERLRLTAGHLSRAISVGAEARSPLVGPAYCEDQRQSVSTLCSALSFAPFTSLPPTLTLSSPCLCLLLLYLFEFCPDVLLQLSG